MKNNLFLLLSFLLFSCQKEEDDNPTIRLLKGVWKPTASTNEFYDASNVKVHEDLFPISDGTVTITDKKIYFNYSNPTIATYQIAEKNGKKYLYVTPEGGTFIEFEISTLTEHDMAWLTDMSWFSIPPSLTYYENGEEKQAANFLAKIEYKKQ